jgi:hypothetical protein
MPDDDVLSLLEKIRFCRINGSGAAEVALPVF